MNQVAVNMLTQVLPWLVLISIRVTVTFALMPAPFGSVAPGPARALFGFLVSIAIGLSFAMTAPPISLEPAALLVASVGELLIGGVIGLTVRVTLAGIEIAGTLSGTSMALGFAGSIDPTLGESTLPTTKILGVLGTLIFFVLKGHHVVLQAFALSLDKAPPGRVFDAISWQSVLHIGGSMLAQGLRIALPVMATMFLIQLGTGLVSRIAPKVHIFMFMFAVASATGMLTLYVAAPSIANAIGVQIQSMPSALRAAFGGP